MNIDTYISNVRINDIIILKISYKARSLLRMKTKSYNKHLFITNISDGVITLNIKLDHTLQKLAFCTHDQLKTVINESDHILVKRPKAVNGRIEIDTLVDEEIDHG